MVVVKYKTGERAGTYVGKTLGFYARQRAKVVTDINKARVYTNAGYAKRSLDAYGKSPFDERFEVIELKVEAI